MNLSKHTGMADAMIASMKWTYVDDKLVALSHPIRVKTKLWWSFDRRLAVCTKHKVD